jgi:hypothetical protein
MAFREIFGVARTSAALPAAGAYDTAPISIVTNTYKEVSFKIGYTRGGAAGALTYKIEFSDDNVNWYQQAEIQAPTITPGSDEVDVTQRTEIKYVATGANQENFMSPTLAVSGRWTRIVMRESGNVGAPGTALATVFMQGDS